MTYVCSHGVTVVTQLSKVLADWLNFDGNVFRRKTSIVLQFWYSLFMEKEDFDNDNSVRMKEREDISLSYISKCENFETWSR